MRCQRESWSNDKYYDRGKTNGCDREHIEQTVPSVGGVGAVATPGLTATQM